MSAGQAVGSGYEGVFSRREFKEDQRARILELLEGMKDVLVGRGTQVKSAKEIYLSDFAQFPPNQQALLLFLRAIVSRPKILVLDEASQAMDEVTWARCRLLLEREWEEMKKGGMEQAVVCVSHYEEEVPWEKGQGKVLRLQDGRVVSS